MLQYIPKHDNQSTCERCDGNMYVTRARPFGVREFKGITVFPTRARVQPKPIISQNFQNSTGKTTIILIDESMVE